jgi:hypothetical protein
VAGATLETDAVAQSLVRGAYDMTIRSELRLSDLLAAEDDPAIAGFRCPQTGVLLWPHIRVVFFRMMMSDLFYKTALVSVGAANSSPPWARALTTLGRSVLHNARAYAGNRCRADICIVTDSVNTILVEGKWFNCMSDYLAHACAEQTLVLEDHFNWKWIRPRSFSNVLFHAPRRVEDFVVGRAQIRASQRRCAAELVELACSRARQAVGWEIDATRRQQLTQMAARKLAGLPHQLRGYSEMLRRIRPKLLLIVGGCYGPAATLIAAARQRSVLTAEFQHGMISAGHDAYNFAPTLLASSAYRLTLPDFFLGYGNWWMNQINAPVRKHAIGNPRRQAQVQKVGRVAGDRRDVLVLGDGIETEKYLNFAAELVEPLRRHGLRSVFRPHPLERPAVATVAHRDANGFRIDLNDDIYASLAAAHAVISEQSSGLFEAIGLADKVFIWNTAKSRFGLPSHPFQSVDSAADLGEQFDDPEAGWIAPRDVAGIWAPDWRPNYLDFLGSCEIEL